MHSQNVTLPEIPELYETNFLDILLPPSPSPPSVASKKPPKNPMMDALLAISDRTLTANGAPAYSTTRSATLDAFSGIFPNSYGKKNGQRLTKSWAEDPELTLRIIWNIRSIHDGKGDKELFYRAFGWLYDNHPRTAIANLHLLVKPVCTRPGSDEHLPHGYWKDILNILALATVDELSGISAPATFLHDRERRKPTSSARHQPRSSGKKSEKKTPEERDARIAAAREATAHIQAKAKEERILSMAKSHARLVEKLAQPKFRALYIAVVRLFGEQLKRDLKLLDTLDSLLPGEDRIPVLKQLSLVGKWAPTPGGSHDRQTNITTAICQYLLRSQGLPTPLPAALSTLTTPHDTQLLRSFFQRWVLTPLREALGLPERLMTANRWKEIKYDRVASVCMMNNAELFYKHDPEGFEKYIASVESGSKKISGAVLLPYDIVESVLVDDHEAKTKKAALKKIMANMQARVAEVQWKTMISRLRESGTLDNSLAVCDVSGSMGEFSKRWSKDCPIQPILPAVSLSLVLAQLAKPPFHNGFITFTDTPQFVRLDPTETLSETVNFMHSSDSGMNTNLQAVFIDLLLPLAVNNNLKPEDMIKRLFIFSDMQFDESQRLYGHAQDMVAKTWETTHDVIEKAYEQHGYKVPQIVYWNLAESYTEAANPVTAERNGVAMMNGFSPAMLKVFMGEGESPAEAVGTEEDTPKMDADGWEDVGGSTADAKAEEDSAFNPLNVMKSALQVKSFNELVVLD